MSVAGTSSAVQSELALTSPLGLVAGNGSFPLEFIKNAHARGLKVVVLAHKGETDPAIEAIADECVWIKVGELGRIIKVLKHAQVKQVAFIGGIKRIRLFGGVKLDAKAIALLLRLGSRKDDAILRGVAAELKINGLEVIPASVCLQSCVPSAGTLTRRALSESERSDARVGFQTAKVTGELDIGQTVVAFEGVVTAVEAVEGTDMALKRAGELVGRKGGVVVKLCKPQQDLRLDLPSIGINTITTMSEAGLTALVLEAGKSLILDPLGTAKEADRLGIAISVVSTMDEI